MAKSFRDRAKSLKTDLVKRQAEGHGNISNRERFGTIFDKSKFPPGVEVYRMAEGENEIDYIPFFAGKQHPFTEEGEEDYKIELFTHSNIGAGNKMFVCPNENFGKPCPICEYMAKNRLEKADWQQVKATHRVINLVWAHHKDEEKKGIQIMIAAHFSIQAKVEGIAKLPRGGGYIPWFHQDKGQTVLFEKVKKGEGKVEYTSFRLVPRDKPIPDKILDSGFALDEVIHMHPTYEEIKEAFEGVTGKEDSHDDLGSSNNVRDEHDMGNDVPDYCPDCKKTLDKCSCKTADEEDVCDECGELKSECTCKSEADPLEGMSLKELKQHVRKMEYGFKTAGLETEEIKELIRDAEKAKGDSSSSSNSSKSDGKCPGKGTFGADLDLLDHCANCALWDDCSDENDKLKK